MESDEAARFVPGTHGCHEALHMAIVLAEMVDERLCEHPAVQLVPAWQRLAAQASEALHDLYQAIGAKHGDDGFAAQLAEVNKRLDVLLERSRGTNDRIEATNARLDAGADTLRRRVAARQAARQVSRPESQ